MRREEFSGTLTGRNPRRWFANGLRGVLIGDLLLAELICLEERFSAACSGGSRVDLVNLVSVRLAEVAPALGWAGK